MVTNGYPQTGSTLYQNNGFSNKTSTALTTNIIIQVGNTPVGAIQSIGITEQRNIKPINEVGTDGTIDSVPNSAATFSVNCTRIRFDKLRIAQAFSRGFIHVQSQRYPFDILIIDNQSQDPSNQIITTIKNCWINQINYTYTSSEWVVSETMNCNAETIFSVLGNSNGAVGNIVVPRLVNTYKDAIEQETDVGRRRGSLDAQGLIDMTGGF
jgi:hypothetical protein